MNSEDRLKAVKDLVEPDDKKPVRVKSEAQGAEGRALDKKPVRVKSEAQGAEGRALDKKPVRNKSDDDKSTRPKRVIQRMPISEMQVAKPKFARKPDPNDRFKKLDVDNERAKQYRIYNITNSKGSAFFTALNRDISDLIGWINHVLTDKTVNQEQRVGYENVKNYILSQIASQDPTHYSTLSKILNALYDATGDDDYINVSVPIKEDKFKKLSPEEYESQRFELMANLPPQPKEEPIPVEENPLTQSKEDEVRGSKSLTKQAAENKIVDQSLGNEQALVRAQSTAMNANNNAAQQTGAPDPLANQMATTNEQQQELNTQLSKLSEEDFTQDELINKPQTPINSFINNLENSAQTPFTQTLLEVLKKNRDDGKVSASIDDNNQMKFHYKGRTYNPETFLLIMNNKVVRKMRNKERGANEKEDRNKKRGVIERQYLKNYDAYKLTQMRENEMAKRKASFNGYRVNPVILQSNL